MLFLPALPNWKLSLGIGQMANERKAKLLHCQNAQMLQIFVQRTYALASKQKAVKDQLRNHQAEGKVPFTSGLEFLQLCSKFPQVINA